MKTYAAAISAQKHEIGAIISVIALDFIEAESEDEAYGKAIKLAKKFWPREKGYNDYNALLLQVEEGK